MKNKITKLGFLAVTALFAAILSGCGPVANNANQANNANTAANANAGANANSSAGKALAGCYDTQINNDIRTAIKGNPNFNKIIKQINWNSKDCVVELVGFAEWTGDTKAQTHDRHLAIIRLAWTISPDVKGVIQNDFKRYKKELTVETDCPAPDWLWCGDVCVRAGTCNNEYGLVKATPTNSPAQAP